MQKRNFYPVDCSAARLPRCLLLCVFAVVAGLAPALPTWAGDELITGYYAREGNGGSPALAAGNDIYLKFYPDRWLGMLFIPYPGTDQLAPRDIVEVFAAARKQTAGSAFIKGRFGLLSEPATVHIERYGYLQDRIAFECNALSACTISLGEKELELIKPGIINEHIIRYRHVAAE